MTPYDMIFADQSLEDLILDLKFPDGSPLSVGRARMWEGKSLETAEAVAGAGEPWASFLIALARINNQGDARPQLRAMAEDAFQESRARLWAWTALRGLGETPGALFAPEVLGFVVEVPVGGGLDVLGAYSDGSVRFLGHADQMIIREVDGKVSPSVYAVLHEAQVLMSEPTVIRDPQAAPPPDDKVRLTTLSAQGLHQVTVPWSDVEVGAKYDNLFKAAAKLLEEVTA